MARKRTYYDPHDGKHYYHGQGWGVADWESPEEDKDETYTNQYNYTPSYNAYRQYLEEERRAKRSPYANPYEEPPKPSYTYNDYDEAMKNAEFMALNNPNVSDKIKAGLENLPGNYSDLPADQKYKMFAEDYDKKSNPEYYQWKKEMEGNPVPKPERKVRRDSFGNFVSDVVDTVTDTVGGLFHDEEKPKERSKEEIEAFKKKSDDEKYKMYIDSLEQKAKDNGTLSSSERLEVTNYMYSHLNPTERMAIDKVMMAERQEFGNYVDGGDPAMKYADPTGRGNWSQQKYKQASATAKKNEEYRQKLLTDAIKILKAEGWDDAKIDRELMRYKEFADYGETLKYNERYAIDPNASTSEKVGKGILNTVEAVPSVLYRGIEGLFAEKGAYGKNTSSRYEYSGNASQEAVGQVSRNAIGDEHPIWQKVYEAGEAGAESLVVMLTGNAIAKGLGVAGAGTALSNAKKAGDAVTGGMRAAAATEKAIEMASLVPFSASAYDSGYKDAVERGYGEGQAIAYAMSVGAVEALTEIFSLDRAWKMAEGTKIGRNLFASAAIQAGIEGSEEMVSEIGSRLADYMCVNIGNTGKTQKQIDIEEYMAKHPEATYQEAAEAAAVKFGKDILGAGAGGVLSSAPHSALFSVIGAHSSKYGKNINQAISDRYQSLEVTGDTEYENQLREEKAKYENNPTQYVVDNFKIKNEEDAKVKQGLQEIADKEKAGKKLSVSDKAYIAEHAQVDREFIEKLYDIGEDSVVPYKYRDVKTDINEDQARTMLAEAAKTGSAEEFAKAQLKVMNSTDEYVSQHADEIISDLAPMAQGHGITQEAIGRAIITEKQAYLEGLKGNKLEDVSNKAKIANNEGLQKRIEAQAKTVVSSKASIQNAAMQTSKGQAVTLTGVFDENGVKTTSGVSIKIENLDTSSESAVIRAYQLADNYKNVITKNTFLMGITDNTNIDDYNRDFKKVYDMGLAGVSEENMRKGYSTLTDEQKSFAYLAGLREAKIKVTNEVGKDWGVARKGTGTVINTAGITDQQALDMCSNIATLTRLDIEILPNNIKEKNARGAFDKENSKIYVSANDVVSVLHEIGHYIQTYNSKGYEDLRKAVANLYIQELGADKYNDRLDRYERLYGAVKGAIEGKTNSADRMSAEMFNDTIAAMFSTKEAAQKLADYLAGNYDPKQAKSLGQKAANVVKKLADTVRRLVGAENAKNTQYAEDTFEIADKLAQHADEFLAALDTAIENYKKVHETGNEGSSGVEYSLFEVGDVTLLDEEISNQISVKDLLGSLQLGRLEDAYEEYVKNPKKYNKTKAGDVIIPIEAIGGGIDKIAIVDNTKYQLTPKRIYVVSDDVYSTSKAANFIIQGEIYGTDSEKLRQACGLIYGGQGVYRYVVKHIPTPSQSSLATKGQNSFQNNGFGRNMLNRKRVSFASTGGKSRVAVGNQVSVDSQGNSLSQDQQEYFEYSKERDKNGSLKVMHHGTSAYGFDVFDPKKIKRAGLYGSGFYFSDSYSHAGQYGKTYDVYLNIVDPLQPGTKTITDEQLIKFINAVANNDDYGIENYGQEATPQSILKSLKGKDDFGTLQDINATCIGDFVEALKLFNRVNGTSYDGIITPTESVVFYSNQIKDINNKKPTSSNNIYFSLTEDEAKQIKKKAKKSKNVDITPNLVAVHNLGEEQLIETLKLKGLPSPSIAIIKSGMMHDKYGDISLVFNSDTIDPNNTKNNVYGGDGWTPTFPSIEYKPNMKVINNVNEMLNSLPEQVKHLESLNINEQEAEDALNRGRGDIARAFDNKSQLKYMFITSKDGLGEKVLEFPTRIDNNTNFEPEIIEAVAEIIPEEAFAEGYNNVGYEKYKDQVEEIANRLNYEKWSKKYQETANKRPLAVTSNLIERSKTQYSDMSRGTFDGLMEVVGKYKKNHNQMPTTFDKYAFKDWMNGEIKGHEEEYAKWLNKLFDGVIEARGLRNNKDYFDYAGNKRSWKALHDEYNLDNIVKIMNAQNERGEAAFFSQSAIQALSTKKFKSLDEIRAAKDQLYEESEEEHEARITRQAEQFRELAADIADPKESNSFIAIQDASDAIADAIREGRTVKGIDKVLREYVRLDIKDDTAQKIVDLMHDIAENPTGYFEAKPRRAVWLDEIKKAVIPDDVSEDLIKALEDNDIPYETYRHEDEGMRRDIIAGMDDLMFSLTEDSQGRKLTKDQKEYFKNETHELRDENGALKVMYHGTPEANFTIFDPEYSDDGISLFFTDDRFVAAGYAGTDTYVDVNDLRKRDSIHTLEDLKKRFEDTDWEFREEDGQIVMYDIQDPDDPYEEFRVDSVEEAYQEWIDNFSWGGEEEEFGGLYECYLKSENPLVVDADYSDWRNIYAGDLIDKDAKWYHKLNIIKEDENGKLWVDWQEDQEGSGSGILTHEEFKEKFGNDLYDEMVENKNGYQEEVHVNPDGEWIPVNTRGLANYAKKHGYDALIVNNLVDPGQYSDHPIESQVVVVFNSNQIKSIHNEHPSEDNDIRYSLVENSYGDPLVEGQQKYFNNSQNLDEEGRLKVMYHGTDAGGFTVFDPEYSDDRISLFFSDSPEVSSTYIRDGERHVSKPFTTIEDPQEAIKFLEGHGYKDFKERVEHTYDNKHVYWDFIDPDGDYDSQPQFIIMNMANKIKRADNTDYNYYDINNPKGKSGIYKVYLNLENPLVIDAKDNYWNSLTGIHNGQSFRGDFGVGTNTGIDLYVGREIDGLYEVISDHAEINGLWDIGQIEDEFGKDFADIVRNANRDINLHSVVIYDSGHRKMVIPNDTRGAALLAKYGGYDGVIIKNLKDNGSSGRDISSNVAIAFSPDQVKDINNLNPTSSADIRYSLKDVDDEWVNLDSFLGETRTEEKAIDILEKGMEALKNKEVDLPKLRTLALKIRNEYGSSYNTNTLTENLRKAFAYMQTEDHVDYQTMMGILRDIARPVIEESGDKVGEEEYKQFIDYFKGKKIKLTEKMKEEVRYRYGSYGNFRNAVMPIMISDNGEITLDQLWDEAVEQSNFMLDRDAAEGEMPLNLLDTLQAMRPTVRNDFGGDVEDMAKDLAMRIVEEYIEGEAAKQMGKEVKEYRAKLKKDYQERLKKLRGEVNAEARARNKRRSEEAKDRAEARDLRHKIKINANKLLAWAQKPTEGKSIPHNMMVPVTQFLQAIDFVEPVITQREDGKWHTRIFDHMDYEDGKRQYHWKDLVGDSREDVLKQFNEAIGRGEGSREQRSWTEKMRGIQEIYNNASKSSSFEDTTMDSVLSGLDTEGLAADLEDMLNRNRGTATVNNLNVNDLRLLNNVITNVMHAINQGNKAYSKPSVDIVNLAQSTIQDAKDIQAKSRRPLVEKLHSMLRLNNVTPSTFFQILGTRSIELYKFLRNGQNQEILDIKKASEFMEEAIKGLDLSTWTGRGATVHEIPISSGTIRMTDDQIMSLYLTVRRKNGMERIRGGIRPSDIDVSGAPIHQNVMHLTEADIQKIEAILTPEQIELAKKMQQYLAIDCSKQGNETSRKLYGFEKFVDPTYYPWKSDNEAVPTKNEGENVALANGLERSGFTKQLVEGATSPLLIRGIFDVFTDHVAQMAQYHGYAAASKDVMRWLNYREISDSEDGRHKVYTTNKKAINTLCGVNSPDVGMGEGARYVFNLISDINQSSRSSYIDTFGLIGKYKAAAVGANARVVAQQPTAYFRALDVIDPKYLLTVSPKTALSNVKRVQEECPIAWWKSHGYYETNMGQSLKQIITGIDSNIEKARDALMAPAGYADDLTWGFLFTAVEKEQRALHRGEKLTEAEFKKAVRDRFDEVVDRTQVVDTTLHRSQMMRSTDTLNKIQTAFMAEPTKSYNMLLSAAYQDMNEEDRTFKRTARAVTAFFLSALATSAAAAVVDAMRKTGDDDDWWEVWAENLRNNFLDNINPLNLLPVVKDVSAIALKALEGGSSFGQTGNRFDLEAINAIGDLFGSAIKYAMTGESNKTGYGWIMAVVKPLSQITGVPVYNLMKDTVSLYNLFFDNIETNVNSNNTVKNEKKKDFIADVNKEKSEEVLDEGIIDALNSGVSIYDLKSAVQSEYKNKYFDLYSEGNMDDAQELANRAARAYARMGLPDEEIDDIINGWQEEAITYSKLDKAIASGEGIAEEIEHVKQGKDDDKIIKHIMDRYTETVAFEDTHDTESSWRENVETALKAVDPTLDFDTAHEEALEEKAKKDAKAAETAKNNEMKANFFDAVDKKDGAAGRRALETMKAEGMEAKTVKSAVSTRYHDMWKEATTQAEKEKAKSDWKSAYKLVNEVYGTKSNDLDKTWADWEKDQE